MGDTSDVGYQYQRQQISTIITPLFHNYSTIIILLQFFIKIIGSPPL